MREIVSGWGEEQRERDEQTPHQVQSPMGGSIPGPQDLDLSRSQTFNRLSHPGAQNDWAEITGSLYTNNFKFHDAFC